MALNWAMLNPDQSLVPLPHEQIITAIESGAELILNIPDAPPSSSSASTGGSGGNKKMKEKGRIWLTDQRLVFAIPPGVQTQSLQSLSIPLLSILSASYEQPMFGANYISFEIKPSPDGGLTKGTKAEIRLSDRGILQFWEVLQKPRERAIYERRSMALEEEEGLPLYTSPVATGSSTPMAWRAPSENPPGYEA